MRGLGGPTTNHPDRTSHQAPGNHERLPLEPARLIGLCTALKHGQGVLPFTRESLEVLSVLARVRLALLSCGELESPAFAVDIDIAAVLTEAAGEFLPGERVIMTRKDTENPLDSVG